MEERRNLPSFEDSVTPTVPIDANNEGTRPDQAALHDDGDTDLQRAIAESVAAAPVAPAVPLHFMLPIPPPPTEPHPDSRRNPLVLEPVAKVMRTN